MGKKKYVMSSGLAFFETKEMERLSEFAKKGWFLEKFAFSGFVLRKGEPQDLDYSLDYQAEADDEYFSYFEEAGWNHVCTGAGEMHIFTAVPGTTPIYSDRVSVKEKYEKESQSMKKVALPAFLAAIMLVVLLFSSENGFLPTVVGDISEYVSYAVFIVLIFTGMPYLSYQYKLRKLEKRNV
ncbi:DUF2812 domain-containing protein [Guptibacillus hwajinpoensis]|uniref:DUF2812 domain-containing protein n=1 Tax=Guptibacillus hwajinpoensis TaxID=208199 RepID=UPI001CFD1095|nr:DUF2812 domain-containing protein [Pseudalkalibacillus hwajinpoensis]WLR59227.1 DUF2812 domain-containing protein [Pseudalkalibacillus hwajinpoensis]